MFVFFLVLVLEVGFKSSGGSQIYLTCKLEIEIMGRLHPHPKPASLYPFSKSTLRHFGLQIKLRSGSKVSAHFFCCLFWLSTFMPLILSQRKFRGHFLIARFKGYSVVYKNHSDTFCKNSRKGTQEKTCNFRYFPNR